MKILKIILSGLFLSIVSFAQANNGNFLEFKARIGFDDAKERIVAKQFSADGTRLTLIGLKSIQTWDVPTAGLIESHPHEIVQLDKLYGTYYQFSPDGRKVITLDGIGRDGNKKEDRVNAYAFDIATGKRIAVLERPETSVRFAFWSANGETVVTFSGLFSQKKTEISFWNGADFAFRKSINVEGYTWHYLSRDGARLFVGNGGTNKILGLSAGTDEGEAIRVYNTRTGAIEKEFNAGGAEFGVDNFYTHVSSDERFIAAQKAKNIIVWDMNGDSKPVYELAPQNPKGKIHLKGFSEDGRYLFAVQSGTDEYYDAATGKLATGVPKIVVLQRTSKYIVPTNSKLLFPLEGEYREENPVLQTPDGNYAVTRSCEQALVYHLPTEKPLYTVKGKCVVSGNDLIDTSSSPSTNNDNYYYARDVFRLSPNGKLLINFRATRFTVRDLKTGAILQTIARKQDKNLSDVPKWNLEWDIKGRYALTVAENEKSMLIWEINEN